MRRHPGRCRHRAVARLSRPGTRWAARNRRSFDGGDALAGRYDTYGTGAGLPILVSDDGWTWRRACTLMQALPAGVPARTSSRVAATPGRLRVFGVGEEYFLDHSAPGTQPKFASGLLVGRTLDPDSPDDKWEDGGPVVWSDGVEDSNAIDPGVFLDPTTGSLWLTDGSYFGDIRPVESNPKTGKRLYPERKPVDIAINSEASIMPSSEKVGITCWLL